MENVEFTIIMSFSDESKFYFYLSNLLNTPEYYDHRVNEDHTGDIELHCKELATLNHILVDIDLAWLRNEELKQMVKELNQEQGI